MAKEREEGQDVDEPIEGEGEGEAAGAAQAAASPLDIKRLITFAFIAWVAVGAAFFVVFRDKGKPEEGLEAAEQLGELGPGEEPQSDEEGNPIETDPENPDAQSGEVEEDGILAEPLLVSFENTITNISGTNGRRFLKARINIEVANDEIGGKVRAKMVQLRDRLIALLSAKTINELDGWENQDIIRREIKDEFNILLHLDGLDGIKKVYFTEFVIQ